VGKARQQAAVIEVRVGEQHEVEPPEIACVRQTVLGRRVLRAAHRPLEQTAVHQKAHARRFHQQAGAGDFTGCAEKGQPHGAPHPPPGSEGAYEKGRPVRCACAGRAPTGLRKVKAAPEAMARADLPQVAAKK